jgi:serine/threonine protein kinase
MKEKQEKDKPKEVIRVINGKYQIEKKIGEGVSSIVFSAYNIHTGEKVAIKKIKNFLENKYESLRILREILLLRKLKHPNIINLKEIVIEDEKCKELSLILDYLPTDAKKLFKSNSIFDYLKIRLIIFQILLGLNYCQQCQVLHRDLKPENILITEDLSQVKLCDFGLARAVYLDV